MKTYISLFLLFISTLCFSQTFVSGAKTSKIDEFLNYLEEENKLIGSVSVFENNKEVYQRNFGQKNLTDKENVSDEKLYQVGSVTKMFTAVLMAELEENKKITFDEHLSSYFPAMPNADKITLKQMLNHTSGLGNFVVKNDSLPRWLTLPASQEEILSHIKDQGASFQPGEKMVYSNSAYYLLARILEKKYNQSFKEILNDRITEIIEMKNTCGAAQEDTQSNIAASYMKEANEWKEITDFYFPNVSGVGDITSTTHDLNIFMNALFNGKIIQNSSLENILPDSNKWFGEGIMKVPFYNITGYGHGGDTYGTNSLTVYFPANNISVTYTINGIAYSKKEFAVGLFSFLFDKDFSYINNYKPDFSLYPSYEGVYTSDKFPVKIKFFREGNILKAQNEGQGAFDLSAIDKHKFEFKKAGIVIEFLPDENRLILNQRGKQLELLKMS